MKNTQHQVNCIAQSIKYKGLIKSKDTTISYSLKKKGLK